MLKTVALNEHVLCDLESVRDDLKLQDITYDDILRDLINVASGEIENFCDRKLLSRDGTQWLDGSSSATIALQQWPATALTQARYRSFGSDQYVELDITGWSATGGLLMLQRDFFPRGWQNVELTGTFGYKAATHDADLAVLAKACKRQVMVRFQDHLNQTGRVESFGAGGQTVKLKEIEGLSAEVKAMVDPYVKRN